MLPPPPRPIIAACLAAIVLTGCADRPAQQGAPPTPQVSVANPLREAVTDWDDFTGRFDAPNRVEVRARAGGYLQAAHFRDGQVVRAGQVLFTLDPRPAQALLAAAEAQAAQAREAAARAESLLAVQGVSREEYESRKAALLVAEANVRARRLDVEFTRVTAPISGVVSDRRIDPGNVISGGASTADVLTTIVASTPIHFNFDASEAQFLKSQRQGARGATRVEIRLQDETEYRWTGVVDFSDNALDDSAGVVRMRAVVANPNGFLKPGMFGRARVQGSASYPALLIPETAVVSDGARKIAYVVGPDGTVGVKPLQTGPIVDGMRVIRSGLAANDRVVVNGIQRAMPGAKVAAKMTRLTRTAQKPPERPTTAAAPATTASSD